MYAKFFSFLLLLFSTFQIILRPCNRLRFKNFPYRETDDLLRKKSGRRSIARIKTSCIVLSARRDRRFL